MCSRSTTVCVVAVNIPDPHRRSGCHVSLLLVSSYARKGVLWELCSF